MLARPAILLILAASVCGTARAQDRERFREVEAGVDDVGTGAVSTLLRPVDLRSPVDFERVYEVVGTSMFARRAGAVTAVFDRSFYAPGGTPLIPPGTVFYLGSLPVDLDRPGLLSPGRAWVSAGGAERVRTAAPGRVAFNPDQPPRIARRLDLRVGADDSLTGPPRESPTLSIWTSESYRQRRIGEVIRGVAWRVREHEAAREKSESE